MQLPAPFEQAFLDDIPYSPEVLFFDRLEELDRERSRVVCRMPTTIAMPFTDNQRASYPRHVSGAVMIQLTANLGFVHLYHLEGLRHADGWIGYGTHIERAVFKKLVTPGDPMFCACTQIRARRGKRRIFSTYKFEFHHQGELAYESTQSAMWMRDGGAAASEGV